MLKLKNMEEIFKEIQPQKCGDILKIIKKGENFSIELDYQMNILKEQMQNDTDISINERNAKLKEYVENLQKEVDMLNLELERDKLKLMKNNENTKNTKNNK